MIVSRLVVSQVQIYLFTGNKVDSDELEPEFIATTFTITTTITTASTTTTTTTEFIDESTDKEPMMLRYIILFLRKLILKS